MKKRVIHFVNGGGSGATRVALDLALAQRAGEVFEPLLVLRRKPILLPPAMQEQVDAAGLGVEVVDDLWPKHRMIGQLVEVCRRFRADGFLAHGYSAHLWGREAALAARVPVIVHIEHNFEKYLPWRRQRARGLAGQTTLTICVSGGVAERVRELGIGAPRVEVIHNGIDLARFAGTSIRLVERAPDIVMPARFARQKDHATLVRATRRLVDAGWGGQLILAGGGKVSHQRACERLVAQLGLAERVSFPGYVSDMPALLRACRVAVLSTHFEGMGLVLAEAMAQGCAVVASAASGVTEVVRDGENGWLFPIGDDERAAQMLTDALAADEDAQARADRGKSDALGYFSQGRMVDDYERLLRSVFAAAP